MRIRIKCSRPPQPRDERTLPRYDLLPSWPDTLVTMIGEDGTEHPIENVTAVSWRCAANGEPAIATFSVLGAEIDVDGEDILDGIDHAMLLKLREATDKMKRFGGTVGVGWTPAIQLEDERTVVIASGAGDGGPKP